jgi:pyruvate/2-oxoglutarate dehydrogenase complex dihydrolipoamide dehydrogenase (E3) component
MHYDAVVIGGGTAGLTAARLLARSGFGVAIVEARGLGGECVYTGCVPSKTLVYTAKMLHQARYIAPPRGIESAAVELDFQGALRYVREVSDRVAAWQTASLKGGNQRIDIYAGVASLVDAHTVQIVPVEIVGPIAGARPPRTIDSTYIIIATGSNPFVPAFLQSVPYLTSDELLGLTHLPKSMIVLGTGPIGLEYAQAFARLGTQVQVVGTPPQVLPAEDPEVAGALAHALENEPEGRLRFVLGARAVGAASKEPGTITLTCAPQDGAPFDIQAETLLVATGRKPDLARLHLERAGIAVDEHGLIALDAYLRVRGAAHVFVVGDASGGHQFTPVAEYQGRVAAHNILRPADLHVADENLVPWTIFTDPEVARVGLTEDQARARWGDAVRIARLPYGSIDRAEIEGAPTGLLKLVLAPPASGGTPTEGSTAMPGDPATRAAAARPMHEMSDEELAAYHIAGAHIVGTQAGNLLPELVLAVHTDVPVGRIAQTLHVYPTLGMGLHQIARSIFRDEDTSHLLGGTIQAAWPEPAKQLQAPSRA